MNKGFKVKSGVRGGSWCIRSISRNGMQEVCGFATANKAEQYAAMYNLNVIGNPFWDASEPLRTPSKSSLAGSQCWLPFHTASSYQ